MNHRAFYIDGAWMAPTVPNDFHVIDPSTEEVCATISLGSPKDADKAVAAALRAFSTWSTTSAEERAEHLEKALKLFHERRDQLANAMTFEMGAPKDFAYDEQWAAGVVHLEETIKVLRAYQFETTQESATLFHEPIGVAALIAPWNWPMNQVILKVAPALAAGCTVVLKPSEIAPLSSIVLANIIHDAGIPPGVFNLVNGDGAGVGSHLSSHPNVDIVSFTGSTRAGTMISKAAADTHKRVLLELGGKGANIIFSDADNKAVERGVLGCFANTGQSCDAPTRMLVQRDIYEDAIRIAASVAAEQNIGPAHDHGNHIGPLVSQDHWHKVQTMIQMGVEEGARLVSGGIGKPDGLEAGYFVKPTVFADVSNDMRIAQEEVFGPVLVMIPFSSEEEAIGIANASPYGLGNYIQTADAVRARRVAKALRAGMVHINGHALGADTPFGGYKQSGNGREGSIWGLEEYLEIKAVSGLQT